MGAESDRIATNRPELHHLSFEVPDIDAVRRAESTLEELGVEFAYDGIVPHGEGCDLGRCVLHRP